nr:MAG TPA: hypothetical protein [Caudoviricetes sp.]
MTPSAPSLLNVVYRRLKRAQSAAVQISFKVEAKLKLI